MERLTTLLGDGKFYPKQGASFAETTNKLAEYEDAEESGFLKHSPPKKCLWIKYDYRTMCPRNHDIPHIGGHPYWRIPADMRCFKFCPYCGGEIEPNEDLKELLAEMESGHDTT